MKPGSETEKRAEPARYAAAKAAALLLLVVLAYWPVTDAGYIWDDDDYVTENMALRSLAGLKAMWTEKGAIPQYYPLTHTTFWLEYQLWELHPAGYHVTNVLLHALGAFLLWKCLLLFGLPGAWFIALLFAVHPVHVESVAWITERKNVLSGVFYLGALFVYWRNYIACGGLRDGAIPMRTAWYAFALFLFIGALLSKTVTCSLPAVILLLIWWKKGHIRASDVWPLVPFFVIGILMAWVTVHVEKTVVRAVGDEWDLSLLERGLIAGRAIWFYIGKLVWPSTLTFVYPRWEIDATAWHQYIYPLGVAATIVALWLARARWGLGPLAAFLIFCGTLVPALGFFDVYPMRYSFVADHFQYLASIAILTLIVAAACTAGQLLGRTAQRLGQVVGGVIIVLCCVLTWQQTHMYKDIETLWRTTIERNPSAWMAHNNLGLLLHDRGDMDEAIIHYRTAYALDSTAPEVLMNMGNWFSEQDDQEAERWFRRALELRPGFPDAYYNLGNVYLHRGQYQQAADLYQQSLALKPDAPRTLANLAQAYFHLGYAERAEALYRRVLHMEPDSADDHSNLAIVLSELDRKEEALPSFQRALQLDGNHRLALTHYARTLGALNRRDEALAVLRNAHDRSPEDMSPLNTYVRLADDWGLTNQATRLLYETGARSQNIAQILQIGGMLASRQAHTEAEQLFERILRLSPDFAPALYALGHVRLLQGQEASATMLYRKAIEMQPDWTDPMNNLAWVLATARDDDVRDGSEAVRWAEKANTLTRHERREYLNTLAAAYAEAGRFEDAERWMLEALNRADSEDQRNSYEERLGLYRAGKPYRMTGDSP